MNVRELIAKLNKMNPDLNVMTRDVVAYRDLDYVREGTITEKDAADHGECTWRVGEVFCLIT